MMESEAGFGAGSRDWGYREIDRRERKSIAVLHGREIVVV